MREGKRKTIDATRATVSEDGIAEKNEACGTRAYDYCDANRSPFPFYGLQRQRRDFGAAPSVAVLQGTKIEVHLLHRIGKTRAHAQR